MCILVCVYVDHECFLLREEGNPTDVEAAAIVNAIPPPPLDNCRTQKRRWINICRQCTRPSVACLLHMHVDWARQRRVQCKLMIDVSCLQG